MVDTKVILSGLELSNPVIPASGTFGFGPAFAPLYDPNTLGSLSIKARSRARFGNPRPALPSAAEDS